VFQRLPKECKYLVTLSLVISIHGAWPHSLTCLRESTFLLERNDPPDAVQGYARKILHPSTFVNFEGIKLRLSEKHLKRTSCYKRELSLDRGSSNDSKTTMTPGHLPIFKRSRVLTHTLGMLLSPRRITFLGRCRAILLRRSSLMPQEYRALTSATICHTAGIATSS